MSIFSLLIVLSLFLLCVKNSVEMTYGVCDFPRVMASLGVLLKENCAPVRDSIVDEMVGYAEQGQWAISLKICFEVLELMKLVCV